MDKKELKFYDVPTCEVVMLKIEAPLLDASSDPKTNPFHDSTFETEEGE
jgi:hypothetical protein